MYTYLYKCLHVYCIYEISYILFILMLRTYLTCTLRFSAHPLERQLERGPLYVGISSSVRLFRYNSLLYSEHNVTMYLNMQTISTKQVQDLQTTIPIVRTKPKIQLQCNLPFLGYVYRAQAALFRRKQDKCDTCACFFFFLTKCSQLHSHIHFKDLTLSCSVIQQRFYTVIHPHQLHPVTIHHSLAASNCSISASCLSSSA
jgi:hypothetical protein